MNLCLGCMNKMPEDEKSCPFCGHTAGETTQDALREGTFLENRYIVGKMLANDALITTYLGWDAPGEKKVLIRELFPRMLSTRNNEGEITVPSEHKEIYLGAMKSFSDECSVLQRFRGVGCITDMEAVIWANNTIYAVTEFVEGRLLEEVIRENTVTFDSAMDVITALVKTLSPLHKVGVVHCNICPSSIIITGDGRVKLTDFAFAKHKMNLGRRELDGILNTGYAPAELSGSGAGITPKTDVYSLAALMYKMLTGITPPPATQRMENDILKNPSAVSKTKISIGAENAILNALEVYPDTRTPGAYEFLSQLRDPGTLRIVTQRRESSGAGTPRWLKITAPILAAALIGAFVAYGLSSGDKLSLGTFFSSEVQVPNLLNKTEQEASAVIDKAGLTMTITGRQYDERIEEGRVLTQTPDAGGLFAKGSEVEIVMSGGKEEIKSGVMPYVMYISMQEAQDALTSLGVKVNVDYAQSETTQKGLVINQSVDSGTKVEEGMTVTLTVSSGPPPNSKKNQQRPTGNTPVRQQTPTPAPSTPTPAPSTSETPDTTTNNSGNNDGGKGGNGDSTGGPSQAEVDMSFIYGN